MNITDIKKIVKKVIPEFAYAHCDIPCGIYDPHLAQIAALTTVRMNQLIEDLDSAGKDAKLSRYITVKEESAELCKHELRIIWGDYFKPEHLEKYPDLHTHFWNAMKAASKVRQEINKAAAEDLLVSVKEISKIFWDTKGVKTVENDSHQTGGGSLIYTA
tara:strand:+ start:463 stop:942 length:480 start_codon:yes stop_codon:yes gene_type:complete